jgi:hypothetical protein
MPRTPPFRPYRAYAHEQFGPVASPGADHQPPLKDHALLVCGPSGFRRLAGDRFSRQGSLVPSPIRPVLMTLQRLA